MKAEKLMSAWIAMNATATAFKSEPHTAHKSNLTQPGICPWENKPAPLAMHPAWQNKNYYEQAQNPARTNTELTQITEIHTLFVPITLPNIEKTKHQNTFESNSEKAEQNHTSHQDEIYDRYGVGYIKAHHLILLSLMNGPIPRISLAKQCVPFYLQLKT